MEKVSRASFTASGPQCCVSLGEGPDLRVISEGAVGPSPASARQEVLVTTLLKEGTPALCTAKCQKLCF